MGDRPRGQCLDIKVHVAGCLQKTRTCSQAARLVNLHLIHSFILYHVFTIRQTLGMEILVRQGSRPKESTA